MINVTCPSESHSGVFWFEVASVTRLGWSPKTVATRCSGDIRVPSDPGGEGDTDWDQRPFPQLHAADRLPHHEAVTLVEVASRLVLLSRNELAVESRRAVRHRIFGDDRQECRLDPVADHPA